MRLSPADGFIRVSKKRRSCGRKPVALPPAMLAPAPPKKVFLTTRSRTLDQRAMMQSSWVEVLENERPWKAGRRV